MLLVQNNVNSLCNMSTASPKQAKKGRRRTFSDDFRLQVKQNNDLGTLKKSLSSTLQVPATTVETLCNISNVGYDSSLEDLNHELEKLCPLNEDIINNVDNSRYYCDIFSRQSIESGENSSPDLDDENRIQFVVDIPDSSGCEIIVPKRPNPAIPINATYHQPCTNVQILKSSCSAFCDMKILQSSFMEEVESATAAITIDEPHTTEEIDDNASSLEH